MIQPGSDPMARSRRRVEALLRFEREAVAGHPESSAAGGRVYEKLFLRLSPIIGVAGVRALFERSARLVMKQLPQLAQSLAGLLGGSQADSQGGRLRASLKNQDEAAAGEAVQALFTTFLHLLSTFVGEGLTLKVLQGAWPELAQSALKETEK